MPLKKETVDRLASAVCRQRLVDTTLALCSVYSPTGQAGEVSDRLADLLSEDGFHVERPVAGHGAAPAVAVRWNASRPGRTLQFNGHLDTVHLPFVPPAIVEDRITGSGSCDMKGGVAASIEALRILRDLEALPAGSILFTAHDLHEAPWGDGSQVSGLIRDGYVGDAVLLPEYQRDSLAVAGRGQAILKMRISRGGAPIHEVYRPLDEPHVIAVGAELVRRLNDWDDRVAPRVDPLAGRESVFVGQIHSGEIYNQFPQHCLIEGTRRWLPSTHRDKVEQEFYALVDELARQSGTRIEREFHFVRDAFYLDESDALVAAFDSAMEATRGGPLPRGGKPFVDDGNSFWSEARVAAITHGPLGSGAHTLSEWVSVDDQVRVAIVYAATALAYCPTAETA